MQTILVVLKAERSNATTKSEKEVANNCRTKGSEEDDSGSSNGIGVSDEMQTLVFDSQCDPIVNGGEHHYVQRGREHKADDKGIGHEIICNKTNKKCMIFNAPEKFNISKYIDVGMAIKLLEYNNFVGSELGMTGEN